MNVFEKISIKFQDEIVSRKNENGTVILMKMDNSDVFFKIDGIAAQIYKDIESGKSLSSIYNSLVEKFPGKEEQIEKDINSLVDKMKDLNLLCE
ncbi:PqqD family protein [Halobacteriovorax marinus]|uniref:PqqD family protein n=1 Tax=Halobacteriovorax marinus TaxID=97084 RepID=UPI003A95426D